MLPKDVKCLVASYLVKPIHTGNYIKELNKLLGPAEFDNLPSVSILNLLSNPAIVTRILWNKYKATIFNHFKRDMYWPISPLCSIHSPLAIKRVMDIPNWLEFCVGSRNVIDEILNNPYATQLVDKIYEKYPDKICLGNYTNMANKKSLENILIGQDILNRFPDRLDELLTNPSELVFEKYQLYEKFIRDSSDCAENLKHLLKNPNPNLLSKAIPHIQKYLEPFNYEYLNKAEKLSTDSYITSLLLNRTPFASELLGKIIGTKKFANQIIKKLCKNNNSEVSINPSDMVVDLVIKYIDTCGQRFRYSCNTILDMCGNTNPRAIQTVMALTPSEYSELIASKLANNPSAIGLIKQNPENYIECRAIYNNPAIFEQTINKRIIKLISTIL